MQNATPADLTPPGMQNATSADLTPAGMHLPRPDPAEDANATPADLTPPGVQNATSADLTPPGVQNATSADLTPPGMQNAPRPCECYLLPSVWLVRSSSVYFLIHSNCRRSRSRWW
jgi:hypothetical protein